MCATVSERKVLVDTAKIVERNEKGCKRQDEPRKSVAEGLVVLGYDACVCKSKWEKSSSFPTEVKAEEAKSKHEAYMESIKSEQLEAEAMHTSSRWRSRREVRVTSRNGYSDFMDNIPSLVEIFLLEIPSATCNCSNSFKLGEGAVSTKVNCWTKRFCKAILCALCPRAFTIPKRDCNGHTCCL